MAPAIAGGDSILVRGLAGVDARVGDIVQFRTADGVVVHRVIGRRRYAGRMPALLVAGDNTSGLPETIAADQVMGRVVAVERRGMVRRLDTPGAQVHAVGKALVRRWVRGRHRWFS